MAAITPVSPVLPCEPVRRERHHRPRQHGLSRYRAKRLARRFADATDECYMIYWHTSVDGPARQYGVVASCDAKQGQLGRSVDYAWPGEEA